MTKNLKAAEQFRKELEPDVNRLIEDTIREAAWPNTVAWIGVVLGSFAINLLLLMLVTGG